MTTSPGDFRIKNQLEFDKFVRTNPVAHAWWTFFARGDCSKEECLIGIILSLVDINQKLNDDMIKFVMREPPPDVIYTEEK